MYYADTGINWIFVYEVIYEDDCILILKDLGRFHKFDEDRKWPKQIDGYMDFFNSMVRINGATKLYEIQP